MNKLAKLDLGIPFYTHDCDECKFIKTIRIPEIGYCDIYIHELTPAKDSDVIARKSSDGPDYHCGDLGFSIIRSHSPIWGAVRSLLLEKGYLNINSKPEQMAKRLKDDHPTMEALDELMFLMNETKLSLEVKDNSLFITDEKNKVHSWEIVEKENGRKVTEFPPQFEIMVKTSN